MLETLRAGHKQPGGGVQREREKGDGMAVIGSRYRICERLAGMGGEHYFLNGLSCPVGHNEE